MVGMGPDGLEIVANYAAGLRNSTIKSLKKKCLREFPARNASQKFIIIWHGSILGPLVSAACAMQYTNNISTAGTAL